ncbi:MAG: hypothetical protein QXP53_02360 [Candidatus Pacearchaeota archaeon]
MIQIWQYLIVGLISLSGFPVGLLIANTCKEELKPGRKWFKLIMLACLVVIVLSLFFSSGTNLLLLLAVFVFIFLLALAALIMARKNN